ncbi:MAG: hypothetical protein KDA28_16235, partial [Phycisphaerales bacterium]|nr:hypothetical protein [Phycisphaerales bacterium]
VVAAKLRRAAVRGFFKESDAELPTGTRAETDAGGEATGIPWSVVLEVPRVLVSSTGEPQEAQRLLEIVHQAGDFLPWAFGVEDPWAQVKIRVYDMADEALRLQFYSKHPEFKGDAAQTAQAGSSSFGRGCIGVASNDPKGRYDMTATQRVGLFFDNVFHCDLDKGWVRAGLGLYLSHHLCGTRLSLWIQRDEYGQGDGPKLGERLKDPQTDWLEEARIVLRQTSPEMNLVALVGKPAKNFSAEDLVVAHAFGAYLFESRPDDLVEILKRLGKGETPVVVLESELGMTMAGLRERLYDWLAEMRKG